MVLDAFRRSACLVRLAGLEGPRVVYRHVRGVLWETLDYWQLERSLHSWEATADDRRTRLCNLFQWTADGLARLQAWRQVRGREKQLVPGEYWMDVDSGLRLVSTVSAGDELAHLHWAALAGEKSSLRGQRVKPQQAEIRAAFTFPTYRSQGLFSAALELTLQDLAARGVQKVLAYVAPENQPSLRAFQKVGFQFAGRCRVRTRFGVTRIYIEIVAA